MVRIPTPALQILTALVLPLIPLACGDPGGGLATDIEGPQAAAILLSTPTVIFNAPGVSVEIAAFVFDAAGNEIPPGRLEWSAVDGSVARVNEGVVTAVAAGNTVVVVRLAELADSALVSVANIEGLGTGFGEEQFSLIPAGSFSMGGESDGPVHDVLITRDFLLQKTEVTQGQWEMVMGSNPSWQDSCGVDCPVETVTWDLIQEFLFRLNASDPDKNYRLPTEAEWEYAGRAGVKGDSWDPSVLEEVAWWEGNSIHTPHPVAMKRANVWGLHDMLGNVFEFCQDLWSSGYYAMSSTADPRGPGPGASLDGRRVIRGGSWDSPSAHTRLWVRGQALPFLKGRTFGFRIAADP